jgi:hypothetical protein
VFATSGNGLSMALLADGTGHQKVYRVGQQTGDGFRLKSVSNREAVVEKDGNEFTLPLLRSAPRDESPEVIAVGTETSTTSAAATTGVMPDEGQAPVSKAEPAKPGQAGAAEPP